jgi:hypothetical protein
MSRRSVVAGVVAVVGALGATGCGFGERAFGGRRQRAFSAGPIRHRRACGWGR